MQIDCTIMRCLSLVIVALLSVEGCARRQLSSQWAVELQGEGAEQRAEELARRHGMLNRGQVAGLRGVFQLDLPTTSAQNQTELTDLLQREEEVIVAEQQELLERVKRKAVRFSYPTDPLWAKQWSLYNTGQTSGHTGLDLNVVPAWIQGYTGKGVVVSIVDDGLERTHPDLDNNFDFSASLNAVEGGSDPSPSYSYDSHGTKCAGIVGMEKNNDHCGVGVAHHANVGGIKFDLGRVTDVLESRLMGYRNDYISVYSNSWGPSDSGFVVGGPGRYTAAVLQQAATEGRGGLGNIFTFAGGNGGANGDSCAADGYVNSIYTMAVGSVDQSGSQAFYDEDCPAKIAVTYSFNSKTFHSLFAYDQLSTTTVDGDCTDSFTGTSAAAPLLAGVAALVLQANPQVSWRDMQYLVAYTSDHAPLQSSGEWVVNGAGLWVSHQFGFGAIDAEAMVTRARNWVPVPEQQTCHVYPNAGGGYAAKDSPLSLSFSVSSGDCDGVGFLEHVVLTASLSLTTSGSQTYGYQDYYDDPSVVQQNGPRRGDISLQLVSPYGTKSVLLPKRPNDYVNDEGYSEWPFMSLYHWGESPAGDWALTVAFDSSSGYVTLDGLSVTLYGLGSTPEAVQRIPSNCSSDCVRGCAAAGSQYCDACRSLRMPSSLSCVSSCPSGQCAADGYCVHCHPFQLSPLAIAGIAAGGLALLSLSAAVLAFAWFRKCRPSRRNYSTL